MKRELMEILACPICKNPDLDLHVFDENEKEIETGIIVCKECNRYYPIKGTIPIMLPDGLRKEEEDLEFLTSYKKNIPSNVLKNGKPFSLSD